MNFTRYSSFILITVGGTAVPFVLFHLFPTYVEELLPIALADSMANFNTQIASLYGQFEHQTTILSARSQFDYLPETPFGQEAGLPFPFDVVSRMRHMTDRIRRWLDTLRNIWEAYEAFGWLVRTLAGEDGTEAFKWMALKALMALVLCCNIAVRYLGPVGFIWVFVVMYILLSLL